MSIAAEQNSPSNLRLLAAQRSLYSQAKHLHNWRLGLAIGLAATGPLVYLLWPPIQPVLAPVLAFIGGVTTLVSHLVLEASESKKVKQAANIQEQFDVGLYKLSWNKVLVGNKVTQELISSADKGLTKGRETLKDWYADPGAVPYPLDVLLCQRSNLVWDWRLRRHYAVSIAVLVLVLLLAGITAALAAGQTLLNYFLAIFLPSLPALTQGIDLARDHWRVADEKESIENEIKSIWERGLAEPSTMTKQDCRDIQNCIYTLRKKGPLVPDWWYRLLRSQYQVDMYEAVTSLKLQAEAALAKV